jgi:Tol biopolymer transport system component
VAFQATPPVFDLVAARGDRSELTVVAGMSAGQQVRPRLFDEPAWSPDGRTIAFTADLSEPYGQGGFPKTDVFLVSADGTGLRRLTHDGLSSLPVWSPDGGTIIYAHRKEIQEPITVDALKRMSVTLWTMTAEGKEQHPVFEPADGRIEAPGGWSPDGSRFLFTRGTFALRAEDGRTAALRPSTSSTPMAHI